MATVEAISAGLARQKRRRHRQRERYWDRRPARGGGISGQHADSCANDGANSRADKTCGWDGSLEGNAGVRGHYLTVSFLRLRLRDCDRRRSIHSLLRGPTRYDDTQHWNPVHHTRTQWRITENSSANKYVPASATL